MRRASNKFFIRKLFYRPNGFTLLELLLGLMIFSILAVTVYSTFSSGLLINERSQKKNEIYREARWFFSQIGRELENMIPYNFANSYPQKSSFVGTEESISFVTRAADGLKVVSYYLIDPEEGEIHKTIIGKVSSKNVRATNKTERYQRIQYVVRKEEDFIEHLSGGTGQSTVEEVVCINVAANGLKFSFGYLEGEETPKRVWVEKWDNPYLPSNVRIKATFVLPNEQRDLLPLTKEVLIPSGYWGTEES